MAVSTSCTFNNAIVGIPQVGADVDIFETSTTPKYAVGTRFMRSDGNEYVYSHFGATAISSGGLVVATDMSESGTTNAGARILAAGSVTAISGETITPGTAGSHYVELIGGGVTADEYAGGYFQVTDGDGFGYQYRIVGNTASSAKTTGAKLTYYLELHEPIQQTLATAQSSWCRILGSKYANLESATAATDTWIAGITTCSVASGSFGWIQTKGIAGIRRDASNISVTSLVALSDTQPGQICGELTKDFATDPKPIIGYCIASSSAIENQIDAIQLTLE